jgi:Phage P22-like portal protein
LPDTDLDIIREAQDNLTLVKSYETELREEYKRCMKFRALEQWEEKDKQERGNRPTVVIDQLGQYVDQVINDWRRNRMGVKISPGDGGTAETARILDGMIREIEHRSKAHVAYDHAFESMAWGNRGFVQVSTKRRPGTFKKEITILKIANPECVYVDPFAEEPLLKRFALKVQTISRKKFEQDWGKKKKQVDFSSAEKQAPEWFPNKESMLLGEYWKVIETPRQICKLTQPIPIQRDNQVIVTDLVYSDEWNEDEWKAKGVEVAIAPDGSRMEDDEPKRKVVQYLLTGVEVLETVEFEGSYIPIIEWEGKEMWVEGKRKLFSLVSRSLDAQKGLNYSYSSMFERLGQAVRSPIVGVVGQFKTQRASWEAAATKPVAFLEYDPVAIGDKPVGPPQRADFDPRIDQAVAATEIIKDSIRGTMGINTAMLGQDTGKAKSGVAIRELAKEGDNATFDILDNGGTGLEYVGCVVLDLIPKIYSQADVIQIRNQQQQTISIAINQDVAQMQQPPLDSNGQAQSENHFLREGQYHVAIAAAPTHETLRKEGHDRLMEALQYLPPEGAQQVVPVILRLDDFYGAKEVADKLDPPQKGPKIPPQVIQQMQMQGKLIEVLTEQVNNLQTEKDARILELESAEKQKALDAVVKIRVAEISASKDMDKQRADILAAELEQTLRQAHEVGMQAQQHVNAMDQAQQGHEQTMEQTEQAADLAPEPGSATE